MPVNPVTIKTEPAMYHDTPNAPPVNPLPPAVVVLALALAVPELILQAAEHGLIGGREGIGWRVDAITSYGFFDPIFDWMFTTGQFPAEHLIRFATYPFVHLGFGHAVFAVVLVLAIGKMVAEAYSQLAFVVIFFASTLAGALAYGVFLTSNQPLVGGYPPAYGLIGGMSFMLWVKARVEGSNQWRAFSLIAFLMGIQIFFKLVFGGANDWVADLAGFVTGFVLSVFLAPGGAGRVIELLERVRRR